MKVVVPISPARNFRLDGNKLHQSAPSSPNTSSDNFDYLYTHASAPTSPTRATAIYEHFNPITNSSLLDDDNDGLDFAFDFSGQLENGDLSSSFVAADELFDAGKIRVLNPKVAPSPKSTTPLGLWSPRRQGKSGGGQGEGFNPLLVEIERGRERTPSASLPSSRSKRVSRSLSPLRGVGVSQQTPNSSSSPSTSAVKCGGSRRWRLRDLLLFRNASEGRVTGRRSKYSILSSSSRGDDSKRSSFRSIDSNGSMGEKTKGSKQTSSHEIYYSGNRGDELKKKKPLLRHGLFGYLRFNPAIHRGFNGYSFNLGRTRASYLS